MIDTLSQYIESNKLLSSEIKLYNYGVELSKKFDYTSKLNNNEYDTIYSRLNKNHIADNHVMSFDACATNIINNLFNMYVDDDTLVVTTDSEHHSVINNTNKCKHHQYIIKNFMINNDVLANIKKYKKVFVYIIGTFCGSGLVIPDAYLMKIKQSLVKNGVEHIFVLDAVQEMFMIPRDYSIFDYVIGTAHAIIPNLNFGILLSKKDYDKKLYPNSNLLSTYVRCLEILPDITYFSSIMGMNFGYLLGSNLKMTSGVPYLFNIGNSEGTLKPLINKKDLLVQNRGYYSINFRGCWFKFGIDKFVKMINNLEKFLMIEGYCV